jgi:hypothetical protein
MCDFVQMLVMFEVWKLLAAVAIGFCLGIWVFQTFIQANNMSKSKKKKLRRWYRMLQRAIGVSFSMSWHEISFQCFGFEAKASWSEISIGCCRRSEVFDVVSSSSDEDEVVSNARVANLRVFGKAKQTIHYEEDSSSEEDTPPQRNKKRVSARDAPPAKPLIVPSAPSSPNKQPGEP